MSRILNVTLGSDPEVFIFSKKENKMASSIGLIGGTKYRPRQIKDAPIGFCVQEDNVLAEFNIPPSFNRTGFISHIQDGLAYLKKELPEGYEVKIQSSHRFEPAQLDSPKAKTLGCDPDFNAWTGEQNILPRPADILGIRIQRRR
jgi:hypothetical protein